MGYIIGVVDRKVKESEFTFLRGYGGRRGGKLT